MTTHKFMAQRLAWLALAGGLLVGCETMPTQGGAGGLGQMMGAVGALGSTGSGGSKGSAVQDVLQGAAATFKDYSAQEQRQLGEQFASVLLGARPLLRSADVQRYVNQVGWWVALQADKPLDAQGRPIAFDWRFGVIDSDAVNAYATPGGFVFVTVGLLRQLNSEAELAGVLAHEVAHVVRGHYLAAVKKGGLTQMAGGLIQAKAKNQVISGAMVNAVRNIYSKGLDQSDEFDADRQGLLYAARAGYAPTGLPTVLRMYATQSRQDENFAMFFNTHPAPQERVTRLQPWLNTKFASVGSITNEARYVAMRKKL